MQNITIFGIIVAIIIILYGLRMVLRKSDDAAPSLDSPLQFNADSQLPIIPRHVRDQLQQEAALAVGAEAATADEASAEVASDAFAKNGFGNNAAHKDTVAKKTIDQVAAQTGTPDQALKNDSATATATATSQESTETVTTAQQSLENVNVAQENSAPMPSTEAEADLNTTASTEIASTENPATATASTATASTAIESELGQSAVHHAEADQVENAEQSQHPAQKTGDYQLNPLLEAAEIKDFEQESSLLDKHLHEQQRYDDQSSLANAETIIALNVYPHPRKALSGDKTLKVLLKYGLRFGELSCFHRYEEEEEGGGLMFSVLRIGDEGPNGFDLESLSCEQVQGLAFFLALPHRNVQKGFDTMVSIAGLIAREIDGTVYDENNLEFTPQLKEHWRHKAIDYRRGQQA